MNKSNSQRPIAAHGVYTDMQQRSEMPKHSWRVFKGLISSLAKLGYATVVHTIANRLSEPRN